MACRCRYPTIWNEDALMPVYEYRCSSCGPFSLLRALAARTEPAACPCCGQLSRERLLSAPALCLPSVASQAAAHNERACHQPVCARSVAAPAPERRVAGRRPWMLG
ncbi:zinc ribbon domain-containing protein [Chromobacterium haemolyticum]|nr:zinc ribbon domain-containing protein [Chromobacterium haemolyticum]